MPPRLLPKKSHCLEGGVIMAGEQIPGEGAQALNWGPEKTLPLTVPAFHHQQNRELQVGLWVERSLGTEQKIETPLMKQDLGRVN